MRSGYNGRGEEENERERGNARNVNDRWPVCGYISLGDAKRANCEEVNDENGMKCKGEYVRRLFCHKGISKRNTAET
jgi:hypothetical protein